MDAEAAGATPSLPSDLTTTGWAAPPSVVPLIPAMNVAVCVVFLPILITPDSPATPEWAMAMLFEPVVRFSPAPGPSAMLRDPVVFANSACLPVATLAVPVVFENRALLPVATFAFAVVFE